MILDGVMMIIVVTLLTSAHPGLTLGVARWEAGAFRAKKQTKDYAMASNKTESATSSGDEALV